MAKKKPNTRSQRQQDDRVKIGKLTKDLADTSAELRNAAKAPPRMAGAAVSDLSDRKDQLESEIKETREEAAARNKAERDERLANAARLRGQGRRRAEAVSASDLAISEARGDEAGRVGIERVRAAQSASTKGVEQPIDAVVDAAGVVSTKNLNCLLYTSDAADDP